MVVNNIFNLWLLASGGGGGWEWEVIRRGGGVGEVMTMTMTTMRRKMGGYISFIYCHAVVHISGFLMKFGTNQLHTTVCVFLVHSSMIFPS
jgi:hypothetical protein